MSCKEKMPIRAVTSKTGLEMIRTFEGWISTKYNTAAKYNLKERTKLIKVLKNNPSDVWFLGEKGLIHYEL